MQPDERDELLGRLDERTKYIKDTLTEHIAEPACEKCELKEDVASIKTNISWIRRIGVGIPTLGAAIIAIWKGIN